MVIGKTFDIDEMFEEGYEAVFIGSGAGCHVYGHRGRDPGGVYSANEYLTRINLMKAYGRGTTPPENLGSAAIIGGGNVAMDAARCAKRMGAEHVYVLYRRMRRRCPPEGGGPPRQGGGHRVHAPHQPVKVLDDGTGRVGGLECVKMRLTAPTRADDAPQGGGGLQLHPGGGHRGHEPGHQPNP